MRNLEEFIKAIEITNGNSNIGDDLDYHKIFEEKKLKDNSNLPLGVWEDEQKQSDWSDIEEHAWNLITKKGYDVKLFVLWLEALINVNKFTGLEFAFEAIIELFKVDKSLFEGDQKDAYLSYIDKSLYSTIMNLNLNFDNQNVINLFKFEKMHASKQANEFRFLSTTMLESSYLKLCEIYENLLKKYKELEEVASNIFYKFSKIDSAFMQFESFLQYRSANAKLQEVANKENQKDENTPAPQGIIYYRKEAYSRIEEAAEILARADSQSFIVPILRKILKWKDSSMLEIFEDIGSSAQIEALISLLKENN